MAISETKLLQVNTSLLALYKAETEIVDASASANAVWNLFIYYYARWQPDTYKTV